MTFYMMYMQWASTGISQKSHINDKIWIGATANLTPEQGGMVLRMVTE